MDTDETTQCSDESSTPFQVSPEVWMTPCTIDPRTNSFVPIVKPTSENLAEKFPAKLPWTPHEDEMLRGIIAMKGTKAWTSIASELNQHLHQGHDLRHGKQCRERWYNHLDPGLRKGNWSPGEDLLVLEKQLVFGNRWSDIAKLLSGRNENSVKNRWKSMIRKAQKELPQGTDVIRWLIADRQSKEPDYSDPSGLKLISPMMCEPSPLSPFQSIGLMHASLPSMAPMVYPMMAVDSVKRELRSMEQPQQFAWSLYRYQS